MQEEEAAFREILVALNPDFKPIAPDMAQVEQHPLGSEENPVRAKGAQGERDYLTRLRCSDGNPPAFSRLGSVGAGPFGFPLDAYRVTCAGDHTTTIHMDMYHVHEETRAVQGFTLGGT